MSLKIIFQSTYLFLIILLGWSSSIKSQPYKTVKEYKEYLLQNIDKTDFIEGVWIFNAKVDNGYTDGKNVNKTPIPQYELKPYRLAIIKVSDNYYQSFDVDVFDNITQDITDKCSKYFFTSTAIDGEYFFTNNGCPMEGLTCSGNSRFTSTGNLIFVCKNEQYINGMFRWWNAAVSATKLTLSQSDIRNNKILSEKKNEVKPAFSYGTGFAISQNLIMTCFHVVKNAKSVFIRGINGRVDTTYLAKTDFIDQSLDIAILKIENMKNIQNFNLPYSLKQNLTESGESIFVLGYPLQNTMGHEIKLTTGVISSTSGFLGDETLYQISAPIQPGNSGGPLFNEIGNLIGIVSAKHTQADNVGYATKFSSIPKNYLTRYNLNYTSKKNIPVELSKKVKLFKKYIYSIEVIL
ncbi:MAG TPA: serine protease [Chitinophagaceae bacterium]|nr:serine protease [Chitinophagaceae bacterium]